MHVDTDRQIDLNHFGNVLSKIRLLHIELE